MSRQGKMHIGMHIGLNNPPINVNLSRPPQHHHHHHHLPTAPPPPPIVICPPAPPQHIPTYPSIPAPMGDGLSWIPTTSSTCYSLEHKAIVAGYDHDRSPIYIGRAHHQGELIPCKVIPKHRIAYFAYDGKEVPTHNFELCCLSVPRIDWVHSSNGHVPPGAVSVGRTSAGEPLYAGRVHHQGTLTVGKVHCSHGSCYISFGGLEVSYKSYEVMVMVYN